ncbi:hypothetical protein T4E_5153 [Trichinella pseudospiralis]|uniref:Uncharacterized protein n=1 Tax=Trichinella pseudospiralis TaxID=6337 RepID=A0A0V0WA30_TRIPS|nr:hypothetical protein T4E_5153 [Trichinella pseudospiralis]
MCIRDSQRSVQKVELGTCLITLCIKMRARRRSAELSSMTSLNRQLEAGPNLQILQLEAILQFRRYRVSLQADIQ